MTEQLSVGEIYEKAGTLGIAIEAQCYNLILYSVQGRSDLSGFSGKMQIRRYRSAMRCAAFFPVRRNI